MENKTKFNLGEKVWYMYNNRPVEGIVMRIEITVGGTHDPIMYASRDASIMYGIRYELTPYVWVKEHKIYSSKEELLGSL